jgi:3-oxoadipate CoA-transferase beta subunit
MTTTTARADAASAEGFRPWTRPEMAARLARDIPEGWCVNLGIGIPLLVSNFVKGREVIFQSENGIIGMGGLQKPEELEPWLVNAGKQNVNLVTGATIVHHADSFAMIRGGHIDLCVLGAFEVAANGDFANWTTSLTDGVPAVGGAMDLAVGAKRLWIIMEHTSKNGGTKLLDECALPLTALKAVSRVYTNFAVLDVGPKGFEVIDMAPGLTMAALQAKTGSRLTAKAA